MTEGEWLAGTDPLPLLEYVRGTASDRKLRLAACGIHRSVWGSDAGSAESGAGCSVLRKCSLGGSGVQWSAATGRTKLPDPGESMPRHQKITHDNVVQRFGVRLREVRRSRGMTQVGLAEKAEVTVGYLSRLESGGGGAVGLDLLARLAAALGSTVAELVTEVVDPPDPDATLRTQVRELADALAKSADRDVLLLTAQLLAKLGQADR